MRKPRALKPGSRIAVVAPASPFAREEFDDGVDELKQLGFVPVFDESVFARQEYVAGAPQVRADAIMAAWRDESIDALIAVRGGYGSMQVLPLLDPAQAVRAAKPFIGYSDVTAILTFMTLKCGVVSFHGPMLAGRLGRRAEGYDRASFQRVLCQAEPAGEFAPDSLRVIRPGDASGLLLGGNVTQLLASFGTPFAFDPPEGYVLFFDEVGERPYRLDRMITQLKQSGVLSRARAVVINELPRCDEPGGKLTAKSVIATLFADFPGPVLIGLPSGHAIRPAMTLPLGVRCRVVADARPRVVIEESSVEGW